MNPLPPHRRSPVTDPVRILLIEPDPARRVGLCHRIDLDPDLAVIGATGNLRPRLGDVTWSAPDLVVIGLSPEDSRCRALVSALDAGGFGRQVLIIGGSDPAAAAQPLGYGALVEGIRTAGLAMRGRSALSVPVRGPTVGVKPARLN